MHRRVTAIRRFRRPSKNTHIHSLSLSLPLFLRPSRTRLRLALAFHACDRVESKRQYGWLTGWLCRSTSRTKVRVRLPSRQSLRDETSWERERRARVRTARYATSDRIRVPQLRRITKFNFPPRGEKKADDSEFSHDTRVDRGK